MTAHSRVGLDRIELPPDVPGRLYLCARHVVGRDPDALRAELGGRSVIVSFNEPGDLRAFPGYAAWLASSPDARWFPIRNFHAPDLAEALVILDEIEGVLRDGRTIVMHCSAGIGRAGTMAVAVLMQLGVNTPDALDQVARERRGAGPGAGAQRHLIIALGEHLQMNR